MCTKCVGIKLFCLEPGRFRRRFSLQPSLDSRLMFIHSQIIASNPSNHTVMPTIVGAKKLDELRLSCLVMLVV